MARASMYCVCVCVCVVGKAVVSHPQASVVCYHGSHAAGTPPPHVIFFYPPLFLILFLLLQLLLFFFLSDSQMTPTPTANDITTPSLTLCCGESYCTLRFSLLLSSANQRGEPECHPFIHKNQTQVK